MYESLLKLTFSEELGIGLWEEIGFLPVFIHGLVTLIVSGCLSIGLCYFVHSVNLPCCIIRDVSFIVRIGTHFTGLTSLMPNTIQSAKVDFERFSLRPTTSWKGSISLSCWRSVVSQCIIHLQVLVLTNVLWLSIRDAFRLLCNKFGYDSDFWLLY